LFYAVCCDKFETEELESADANGVKEIREVFRLPYNLAPYKVAIIPLTKQQNEDALKLYSALVDANISATIDLSSGSIGKKYRRQDAYGTPYCATIDFDTIKDNKITVRERDSMKQSK
jgi:glycyl-tRNA synthetase